MVRTEPGSKGLRGDAEPLRQVFRCHVLLLAPEGRSPIQGYQSRAHPGRLGTKVGDDHRVV